VTRREIFAGAAACATSSLWAKNHWDRSRVSAITDEIGATADDAASFAHDQGMLFVEVRNEPGTNREYAMGREADMKAAAAHLANENLKVSVVNTSLLRFPWPGSPSADQTRWDHRMEDFQKALRCAQIMGADKIRVFAGTRVADPAGTFQQIADTMTEMASESEKARVSLILENDPGTNVATCADLAAVMKLGPSKWIGINWKPAPDGFQLLPKKRILNVRALAAGLAPGRPESINWRNILIALDKDGYGGRITLEVGQPGNKSIDIARDSLDQLVHIVREVS
jgi:sugar phosphate isomerase/epimerase